VLVIRPERGLATAAIVIWAILTSPPGSRPLVAPGTGSVVRALIAPRALGNRVTLASRASGAIKRGERMKALKIVGIVLGALLLLTGAF
jgi:hypothetical protein